MAQGLLSFVYEEEKTGSGATVLAGLPVYLELASALGLDSSIERRLHVRTGEQGWTDAQIVMSLVMLNLAGGDCVDDLQRLEGDAGFGALLRRVEGRKVEGHGGVDVRSEATELRRWRKGRTRSAPSPSAVFRYLKAFHNEEQEKQRRPGKAFIPAPNEHLSSLMRVNADLVSAIYNRKPSKVATLDMDATLVETCKRTALFCYKKFVAYQPLNVFFAEQETILHSEFRDGNVPAGYQQLRVLKDALAVVPEGVEKIRLRSDTAGYQHELIRYCAHGNNERFGQIEFAIGCDVTQEFKDAVAQTPEEDWKTLWLEVDGHQFDLGQQWAEVCFVPWEIARNKKDPIIRYLAVREAISQRSLPQLGVTGMGVTGGGSQLSLPFPTLEMETRGVTSLYKLHGVVTNSEDAGQKVLLWYRGRCGKSEEAHSVMKEDLAGGQLPSSDFGANAAWWTIMLLALNLNVAMKELVLEDIAPGSWAGRRMKKMRFNVINIPGRIVMRSRQLFIRLACGSQALGLLIRMRERILVIARARELIHPGPNTRPVMLM